MRVIAVLLAIVPILAALFVGWLALFFLNYPNDDGSPTVAERAPTINAFLLLTCGAALVTATVLLSCIALGQARWATATLVVQAAIALALLVFALNVSEHSDGSLLMFVLGAEAFSAVALVLSHWEARRRRAGT